MLTAVSAAKPGQDRALAVIRLLEFAAARTDTPLDDDLTRLVRAVLLTREGGDLVNYISTLIQGAAEQASYEQHRLGGV